MTLAPQHSSALLFAALLLGACAEPVGLARHDVLPGPIDGGTSQEPIDSKNDPAILLADPLKLAATDRAALLLLQAWAELPSEATGGLWPGVKVLQAPTALVVYDADQVARRAWLLAWPSPPAGAQVLQDPAFSRKIWRFDAAAAEAFDATTALANWEVAGTSALVLPVNEAWLQGNLRPGGPWSQLVGAAVIDRWRLVEGNWPSVAPCGQPFYPRDEQAIALFFLECAVLIEALEAKNPAEAAQRLAEWQAIRALYTNASAALLARVRHYDTAFAPAWYAGRRLALLTGQRTPLQVDAEYRAALARPSQVKATEFDATVSSFGVPGAAALEMARRLGWPVTDSYPKGGNVATAIADRLGPPAPWLVDQAIARHPWRTMRARAQAIMAVPVGVQP